MWETSEDLLAFGIGGYGIGSYLSNALDVNHSICALLGAAAGISLGIKVQYIKMKEAYEAIVPSGKTKDECHALADARFRETVNKYSENFGYMFGIENGYKTLLEQS